MVLLLLRGVFKQFVVLVTFQAVPGLYRRGCLIFLCVHAEKLCLVLISSNVSALLVAEGTVRFFVTILIAQVNLARCAPNS